MYWINIMLIICNLTEYFTGGKVLINTIFMFYVQRISVHLVFLSVTSKQDLVKNCSFLNKLVVRSRTSRTMSNTKLSEHHHVLATYSQSQSIMLSRQNNPYFQSIRSTPRASCCHSNSINTPRASCCPPRCPLPWRVRCALPWWSSRWELWCWELTLLAAPVGRRLGCSRQQRSSCRPAVASTCRLNLGENRQGIWLVVCLVLLYLV